MPRLLGRLGAWVKKHVLPAGRRVALFLWTLVSGVLGWLLRGLVYVLAGPVIILADLVQPDPQLDRSWAAGFMGFITLALIITWGLGYLVTVETLQGNALVSEYVEISSDLARVPYLEHIQVHAARHRLDPALVAAIISQESGFRPDAVSPAGARGLMQLLPGTWREVQPDSPCAGRHLPPACGPDCIFDPEANIRAGTAHFAGVLREFDGNIVLAFAAYNAGSAAVRRHAGSGTTGGFEDLPPFTETRLYVRKVLSFWVGLRSGGIPDVVSLSVGEARLLRQLATVMPGVVLVLWGVFSLWVLSRLGQL